ncbi:MAG: hypothetical protein GC178_14585 [Flavobacteriales bacterium]|nr:hypothetical protein [Flavobacteriales bacterium]
MSSEESANMLGSLDDQVSGQFEVNDRMRTYLAETGKWGKFIGIVGFVFIGLIVFAGLAITIMGNSFPGSEDRPINMGVFGIVYIIMGIIYLFPTLYLYRFSSKVVDAVKHLDTMGLEAAFMNLKSLFKFFGVFTAIVMGLYGLIFVGAIIGGGFAALMK